MTTRILIWLILTVCRLLRTSLLSFLWASLPTIYIGQRHKVTTGSIKPPAKPLQETQAPAFRVIVPVANERSSASSTASASSGDSNRSFASSAQQNTALDPKIDYLTGPKELPPYIKRSEYS